MQCIVFTLHLHIYASPTTHPFPISFIKFLFSFLLFISPNEGKNVADSLPLFSSKVNIYGYLNHFNVVRIQDNFNKAEFHDLMINLLDLMN